MNNFEIEIVSYKDKSPVGEIYYNSLQLAEIRKNKKCIVINIFHHPCNKFWCLPFYELGEAIKTVEIRLAKTTAEKNRFWDESYPDPEQVNQQAKNIIEAILKHPYKTTTEYTHKLYGPVIEVEAPNIGGIRFSKDGEEMIGFLEPKSSKTQGKDKENLDAFSFRVASANNEKKVFVEIFYNNEQIGKLVQEEAEPLLIFMPPGNLESWELPTTTILAALKEAQHKLIEG
ncbi:MAG: hypothetical protein RLZZ453_778 [Chlamydiota bacterium]|jgi:hypothetical protein